MPVPTTRPLRDDGDRAGTPLPLASLPHSARVRTTRAAAGRRGDTTAEIIRRLRDVDHPPRLVALGVALHHFTEIIAGRVPLERAQAHAATTVLTKQVAVLLSADDDAAWRRAARLAVDPQRVATSDGRTASELCGDDWPAIEREARRRAIETFEGVAHYGAESLAQLASIRAYQSSAPWWGTDAWNRLIDCWLGDARLSPVLAASLRRAPECAPLEVLRDILR